MGRFRWGGGYLVPLEEAAAGPVLGSGGMMPTPSLEWVKSQQVACDSGGALVAFVPRAEVAPSFCSTLRAARPRFPRAGCGQGGQRGWHGYGPWGEKEMASPGPSSLRPGLAMGLFQLEFSNPKRSNPKGVERRCGSSQQSQAQDGGGDADLKFRGWWEGGGSPSVGLACLGGWRGFPGHGGRGCWNG